jgi:hypothetical protein
MAPPPNAAGPAGAPVQTTGSIEYVYIYIYIYIYISTNMIIRNVTQTSIGNIGKMNKHWKYEHCKHWKYKTNIEKERGPGKH